MLKRARLLELLKAVMLDSGMEIDFADSVLSEAEDGNAPAQYIVASALEKCGNARDASEWYRLAAVQGYRPAQERLRRPHSDAA